MAVSEFEGDVVTPLARFRTRTSYLIIAVAILITAQIAMSFTVLMWRSNHLVPAWTWWNSAPIGFATCGFYFTWLAYRAERGTAEQETLRFLLRTVLSVGTVVLIFFFSMLWLL